MGVREIGSLEVGIIRFFIHASMYLACTDGKEQAVKQIISCQPKNTKEFLENHLKDNLTQIGKMLGKNEEYAQLLLMKVLNLCLIQCCSRALARAFGQKARLAQFF